MYERFKNLLDKRGITPYQLGKETGVSTATLTCWKQGKYVPKDEKLQKIADYLEVTLDYLKNGDDAESKYYINEETAEIAQQMMDNKELRVLFDAARDASPEDLQTAYQMLLALKRKERGEVE